MSCDYELMTSLPLEAEYPMEPSSIMFTNCSNLMFLAPPWLEIYRYSNLSFWWLWAVQRLTLFSLKLIFIFITLGKSKSTLFILLYYFQQVSYFPEFGQDTSGKIIQNNSRTTNRILHKSVFPQSINRLPRFSLLFLSVTRFSDFCDKIKYLW